MAPASAKPDEPQWPPRSPHEVLLGTPSGRERLRRLANRTSPSPSPLRKSRTQPALSSKALNDGAEFDGQMADGDEDEDVEEDQETLELKLQEIQAKLKLKKLQSAKAKRIGGGGGASSGAETGTSRPRPRPESVPLTQRSPLKETAARPASQAAVEVPASPVRRPRPEPPPQTSPSRVLLGIDKGLTAKDISLKRAPSARRNHEPQQNGGQQGLQLGGYLKRSRTPNMSNNSSMSDPHASFEANQPRPLSFNERLEAVRNEEVERYERQERTKKIRSEAFGIGKQELEGYKSKAVNIQAEPEVKPEFSREEVLAGQNGRPSQIHQAQIGQGPIPKSNTVPNLQSSALPATSTRSKASRPSRNPQDVPDSEASSFEPFSGIHLNKRIVPHAVLTRNLSGKKIMTMKDLLKHVKGPDYELPDVEQDIVFFAIIAKRSEPRSHQPQGDKKGAKQSERGKYMVMTLVDLAFELELFLFDSGFTRFWKMSEGTVIAILNPTIMKPPKGREATQRFSLVVNSDADKVIEVGAARDLGFCKSVKKDGDPCGHWVNSKRTEFCEFHTNEALSRRRAARMEVNQTDYGRQTGKKKGKDFSWWVEDGGQRPRVKEAFAPRPPQRDGYDRETQSHWFVSRSLSSADLIDGAGAFADKREKEEGLRRRLLAQEKEKGIMRRLGKVGSGAGKEYMIMKEQQATAACEVTRGGKRPGADETKLDAQALGLLAPKGREATIHLGPVKRKRAESTQSSLAGGSNSSAQGAAGAGFGWGGELKGKLARMCEGEKLQARSSGIETAADHASSRSEARTEAQPPMRKKTRFVTEKGIREAGRESLGDALPGPSGRMVSFEDDDDELVIVR